MIRNLIQNLIRKFELFLINRQNKKILNYLNINKHEFIVVIDIGGHHGELYNSMKKTNTIFSEYHIFEPFDESFEIINQIKDTNLKKYNIGVSNQKGIAELHLSNWETSNTLNNDIDLKSKRNRIKQLIYGNNQYSVQQKIKIDTLDNLFPTTEGNDVFLKIDVEGHEKEVIDGADKFLTSGVVKYILIEIQDQNKSIKQNLQKYGYEEITTFKFPFLNIKDSLFIRKEN